MYKIRLTNTAIKYLKKISNKNVEHIGRKLIEYYKDPFPYSIKLSGKSISTYRFRIGNYRAIFDFDNDYIVFHRIAHRKEIYKK